MSFLKWSLSGSFKILSLSGMLSILTGITEVSAVLLLGLLIDAALNSSVDNPLGNNVFLFSAGLMFFLLVRPIIFGCSSYMQSVIVTPNIFNLVLSRIHRWCIGHSIPFFENDFAGRIANRVMQTPRSAGEVVFQVFDALGYSLAYVFGGLILLNSVDFRLMLPLAVWFLLYLCLIVWVVRNISPASKASSDARSNLNGQIVDTYTNIHSVNYLRIKTKS